MQIRFILSGILSRLNANDRGIIKEIADHTKLERHQISAMMNNKVQYLSLDALAEVCGYLISRHGISKADLPGALFSFEPEDFLSALSRPRLLKTSFGFRGDWHRADVPADSNGVDWPISRVPWVIGSDSYLNGVLMNELLHVSVLDGRRDKPASKQSESPENPHRRFSDVGAFEQLMIPAYWPGKDAKADSALPNVKRVSKAAYERLKDGDCTLINMGSVKSNGLCELSVANLFGAKPWVSQDDVAVADRSCPFYLKYREIDPKPPSCHAGLAPPAECCTDIAKRGLPGIYFERELGIWDCFPCSETEDAALIVYRDHILDGTFELMLGGFSSFGTIALAANLRDLMKKFWPPGYESPKMNVGVFAVRFTFDATLAKPNSPDLFGPGTQFKVDDWAALSNDVLKARL